MFWLLFNFHVLTVTLGVSGFFYCYSFLLSLLVSTLFSLVQLSLSLSFCSPRISPFMFSLSLFQKWLVVPFLFYFDRCLSVSLSSPVSDPNQHSVYLCIFWCACPLLTSLLLWILFSFGLHFIGHQSMLFVGAFWLLPPTCGFLFLLIAIHVCSLITLWPAQRPCTVYMVGCLLYCSCQHMKCYYSMY